MTHRANQSDAERDAARRAAIGAYYKTLRQRNIRRSGVEVAALLDAGEATVHRLDQGRTDPSLLFALDYLHLVEGDPADILALAQGDAPTAADGERLAVRRLDAIDHPHRARLDALAARLAALSRDDPALLAAIEGFLAGWAGAREAPLPDE